MAIIDNRFHDLKLISANNEIVPVENITDAVHLEFGDNMRLPVSSLTSLKLEKNAAGKSAQDYFDLRAIYFAYAEKDKSYTEYFQDCQKFGVKLVSLIIRRDLIDYLTGRADDHPFLASPAEFAKVSSAAGKVDMKRASSPVAGDLNSSGDRKQSKRAHKDRSKEIMSKERQLIGRNTVMIEESAKSFEVHRKLAVDIIMKGIVKVAAPLSASTPVSSKAPSSRSGAVSAAAIKTIEPIILVPATITSMLTLYNAEKFFQQSQFVPSDSAKETQFQKSSAVNVEHQHPSGKKIKFSIVDNIGRLEDWDRVVAVFCSGQDWQFRGWKWQEPVELFTNVKGFHLKYSDSKLDSNVRGWNVSVLEVNRYKRHLDAQCVHQFWAVMDQWIASNKPQVLLN